MTHNTCVFCQIVAGEAPAHIVFEDDHAIGFLDRRPLFEGHVLLAPRNHHETIADLPESDIGAFFADVQLLARAVQEAMNAEGTFLAMNNTVSQSVPHLHVHIVPRRRGDGLRGFFWPRTRYSDDQHRARIQQGIRDALATIVAERSVQKRFN